MVFFDLKNDSAPNQRKLVQACRKHLSGHEGTVHFSVGVIAADLDRDVNDREFDVALHLVFRNHAAHDQYQTNERHLKFIEENSDSWSRVRVFDSYLSGWQNAIGDRSLRDRPARWMPLPDAAASFAGLVRGNVLQVRDESIVLHVKQVVRQWDHSQATDAESLVDKRVVINSVENPPVRQFLRSLKRGDEVTLDVAHRNGEILTLLELTDEQRQAPSERE